MCPQRPFTDPSRVGLGRTIPEWLEPRTPSLVHVLSALDPHHIQPLPTWAGHPLNHQGLPCPPLRASYGKDRSGRNQENLAADDCKAPFGVRITHCGGGSV